MRPRFKVVNQNLGEVFRIWVVDEGGSRRGAVSVFIKPKPGLASVQMFEEAVRGMFVSMFGF